MPTRLTPGAPASDAPVSFFARQKVLRMLGITAQQINHWERLHLVEPKQGEDGKIYSFADLVNLRTLKQLTKRGLPASRLGQALEALRRREGGRGTPLAELRILPKASGRRFAVECDGLAFDPVSGQLLLRFMADDSQQRVEAIPAMPGCSAEEWFELALRCEANPDLRPQAIDAYRHVLETAPEWVDAYINLGTLLYEQGQLGSAIECYRQALAVDPENALVHFNLGTALDELKEFRTACLHLGEAVRLQPDFADAHYNLARVYEEMGDVQLAVAHWRRYLDFDPHSSWAQFARQRLLPGSRS